MSEEDLYRDVILDHFKNPRNKGALEDFDIKTSGVNPFCGDEVVITLKIGDSAIKNLKILAHGCAISSASASMMAETLEGKTLSQVRQWIQFFREKLLNNKQDAWPEDLADFEALEGVKNYPIRIKCAVLAWNTLVEALKEFEAKGSKEKVTTKHQEE